MKNLKELLRIQWQRTRGDMDKGTTYLSQTHYAEEFLRTYNV